MKILTKIYLRLESAIYSNDNEGVSMMHFYEQLKGMRRTKGFTIRELADRSGVSSAYISQLENGNRGVPSPDVLMKLAEGLNTPYTELMKIAGYLEKPASELDTGAKKPRINLRRFLQENDLIFDGIELTEQDKEWIERVLTAMFWRDKQRTQQTDTASQSDQATSGPSEDASKRSEAYKVGGQAESLDGPEMTADGNGDSEAAAPDPGADPTGVKLQAAIADPQPAPEPAKRKRSAPKASSGQAEEPAAESSVPKSPRKGNRTKKSSSREED
jgi:HTH-type transcriptional regulator, competence development regulator